MVDPNNFEMSDLKYVLVPVKLRDKGDCELWHNRVFDFWEQHWTKVFADSGKPKSGWKDHFLRQDLAVALTTDTEVVSCHLCTVFNIDSHASVSSEYFEYIQESVPFMRDHNYRLNMSVEYLAVNPRWTKNHLGVGFGRLTVALGAYVSEAIGCDGILGMPINTTAGDKMAENVGGVIIQENIQKYGYTLRFLIIPTAPRAESKDFKARTWAKQLWDTRIDYTNLTSVSDRTQKKAA